MGSSEVRLLAALVEVVLAHGTMDHPDAQAQWKSAIAREEARLAGDEHLEVRTLTVEDMLGYTDEQGHWRPGLAGLTPQEARAMSLRSSGWEYRHIAQEMTSPRRKARHESLSIRTVEWFVYQARRKLRALVFQPSSC